MKRYIESGRDPNRNYRDLKFTGWTKTKTDIISQSKKYLENQNNRVLDELKRYVRYSISEAEDAVERLEEYRDILEKFNSSSASANDVETLISELKKFKFQNIRSSTVTASSSRSWKKFARDNVDKIVTEVNDEANLLGKDLWGDDFRNECIDRMLELMDDSGLSYPDDADWYLSNLFADYGEEW